MATIRPHPPIWFRVRASRMLLVYLWLLHGLAGVSLAVAALTPAWRILLALLLLASLLYGMRLQILRRGHRAVRQVRWAADGSWHIRDGCGDSWRYPHGEVVLAGPPLILVRLHGVTAGRTRWLVLAADSADAEVLRRLRVRLRACACDDRDDQAGSPAGM